VLDIRRVGGIVCFTLNCISQGKSPILLAAACPPLWGACTWPNIYVVQDRPRHPGKRNRRAGASRGSEGYLWGVFPRHPSGLVPLAERRSLRPLCPRSPLGFCRRGATKQALVRVMSARYSSSFIIHSFFVSFTPHFQFAPPDPARAPVALPPGPESPNGKTLSPISTLSPKTWEEGGVPKNLPAMAIIRHINAPCVGNLIYLVIF